MIKSLLPMLLAASMLLLTIVVFLGFQRLHKRIGSALLNPMLLSIVLLIFLLTRMDISYEVYHSGAKLLTALIEPAVVLLGFPLYKQLRLIRMQWLPLIVVTMVAVFCSLSLVTLLARAAGLEDILIRSLATYSVTTAVAMETSAAMGGDPSLAALCVMLGGMTGASVGLQWLNFVGTTSKAASGFAIGAVSHALGTVSIAHLGHKATAYASMAVILCALLTALVAPYYVPFLLRI